MRQNFLALHEVGMQIVNAVYVYFTTSLPVVSFALLNIFLNQFRIHLESLKLIGRHIIM